MKIRSRTPVLAAAFAAASVVTLALTGTLLYLKHREGELGGCLVAFLAPFVLAGIGLAALAVRELVGIARYGTWELECRDGGGVVGEPLEVRIRPGRPVEPTGEATLTVSCVAAAARHSGQATVLGQSASSVASGSHVDPRAGFATTLELPARLPPSTDPGAGQAILWQLTVEMPARRGDVHVTFVLPVRGSHP
jgi:hypothetical protein